MTPQILKNYKEFTVPNKCIHWSVSKNKLELEIVLDWEKFEKSGIKLPPEEFGRCDDWRYESLEAEDASIFSASWDVRRVRDKLVLIDKINERMSSYALSGY